MALAPELRELAIALVRGQYADFGPTLAHEKLLEVLLEPNAVSRAAAGKTVLVRETHDGKVVILFKGKPLPARAFVKDARVDQGAITDNKVLGAALADIQIRQQKRDALTLRTKRLSLRDEDLMRREMGEDGLPTRRVGRPTTREAALARIAKEEKAVETTTTLVDQILGQTAACLAQQAVDLPVKRVQRGR